MMRQAAFFTGILLLLFTSKVEGQSISGVYSGWWGSTWWEFRFLMNNTYIRTSTGHYGNTVVNGEYKLRKDTIILIRGFENTHGTVNEKYLIDGDSCIIDIDLGYDYCKTRQGDANSFGRHVSVKRNILYPQLPTKNRTLIRAVENILQQAIDWKELDDFYHRNDLEGKPLIIQEYFEINSTGNITLTKFEQPVLFKSMQAIAREGIRTYIIIKEIDISSQARFVHFEYKIDDVTAATTMINFHRNKENGLWEIVPGLSELLVH